MLFTVYILFLELASSIDLLTQMYSKDNIFNQTTITGSLVPAYRLPTVTCFVIRTSVANRLFVRTRNVYEILSIAEVILPTYTIVAQKRLTLP